MILRGGFSSGYPIPRKNPDPKVKNPGKIFLGFSNPDPDPRDFEIFLTGFLRDFGIFHSEFFGILGIFSI